MAHFTHPAWWKESIVYQIYPASFKSTGSGSVPGWGDIRGVTSKLDYLKDLGVNILWLSPIYKSPQFDMGYDISDYEDIDPRYGSLSDVDELISELKKRDMKLMMDLVVNHTSSEHAWFKESRSSKRSEKRAWYIWQPPKYSSSGERQPPNNWAMILGEANSAWTWDEETQEYYLSLFTPAQPDLNWRNPSVRAAVHDVLRFWLDRGVCGFRMDVINLISKVDGYPDAEIQNPEERYQPGQKLYANGPRLHEYLHEMNHKVLSKYNTITVGECPWVDDEEEILRVVGAEREELNMIFIFDICDIDRDSSGFRWSHREWTVSDMKKIVARWQRVMREGDGWNSVFIENHDTPRSVSRYCSDSTEEYRQLGAKLLAVMQSTLPGTLYLYQGEELGMKNFPLSWGPEEYKDVESVNYWKKVNAEHPGDEKKLEEAKRLMQLKARDHARTPVQWDGSPNAGFCDRNTEPWMRVNDDFQICNAELQTKYPQEAFKMSIYQFWQQCLRRRKEYADSFVYGDFSLLDTSSSTIATSGKSTESVLAYTITSFHVAAGELEKAKGDKKHIIGLNFSNEEVYWDISAGTNVGTWLVTNYDNFNQKQFTSGRCLLRPWEALLGTANV